MIFPALLLTILLAQISCGDFSRSKMVEPIVLVHGGAGDIADDRVGKKVTGVKKAASIGYNVLKKGGSATDAVEAAINYMEGDEAFNCGIGSVLNLDGEVEMDASIMVGQNLMSGGVTVVKDIANPISLARMVMERTPHFILAGAGANRFAKEQGVPLLPPGALITPYAKEGLDLFKKTRSDKYRDWGTVGAVAIDAKGHLAAATSTGGLNGKMVGRGSDSSVIGSGTYADDTAGAASSTGHGESIARYCLAHSIITEMKKGESASVSTYKCLQEMTKRLNNTAGAIALSRTGETGVYFTTKRMPWAYQIKDELHFGVEHGQHTKEKA